MKNISKIFYGLCLLLLIIGFIIFKTLGINYSTEFSKSKIIEIYFDNSVNTNEIVEISKKVFGDNIIVKEIERFNDSFSIQINQDLTDEQKNNFINKINEKYNIQKTTEDLTIIDVPKMQGIDLIKIYIKPAIISLVLILIYLTLRYIKIGNIKLSILTILKTIVITGAYFGVVLITRLPIVNLYTIPIGILIATITLYILCYNNEKIIEKYKNEKTIINKNK